MKKIVYSLVGVLLLLAAFQFSNAQAQPACNTHFVRSGISNTCFNANPVPLQSPVVISATGCTQLDLNTAFTTFGNVQMIIPSTSKTVTLLVAPVLYDGSVTGLEGALWRYYADSNCTTVLSGSTISGFKGLSAQVPGNLSGFTYRAYFEDTVFINGQTAIYVKSLNTPVSGGTASIYFSGLISYTDN
jgi:hypothetical protein